MTDRILRIGTRGSLLALRQSEVVKEALARCWPGLRVELQIIKTTGDKILDVPLAQVGGKGLFVKEIEEALLHNHIDLAVHSMKDVPSELPADLEIGAIPRREDSRDVLIARQGSDLLGLPEGATVGTSSLRRAAQLKGLRPDLQVENLRGNLDTRLRKVREGQYDAIVVAAAGLIRLGWQDRITCYLDPDQFLPAVGQGAIGLEMRRNDREVRQWVAPLHHPRTASEVTAERGFLQELEGGCQVPIGGYARVSDGHVALTGLVAALNGRESVRLTRTAAAAEAARLGRDLAREILAAGGRRILDEVYRKANL